MFPEWLKPAVTELILNDVFFSQVFYALENLESEIIPTAGTNGVKRFYNKEFMMQFPVSEQVTIIKHEICHDIFEDMFLAGTRNKMIWNIACDYKNNQLLDEEKNCAVPKSWLRDTKYDKMSKEQVYEELIKGAIKIPVSVLGQDVLSMENDESSGEGEDGHDGKDGSTSGISSAMREELRQKLREQVQAALATAKAFGSVSAGLERAVHDVLFPKEAWRDRLKKYFHTMSWKDYDWSKINHRELFRSGFIAPKLYSEDLGTVMLAVDCSGSIGEHQLGEFQSVINDIFMECNPQKARVVYFDTRPLRTDEFEPSDYPVRLTPVGGGGTDFRWLLDQEKCDVCVFLTDGYGSMPTTKPDFPVIVVLNHANEVDCSAWSEETLNMVRK